MRLAMSNIAWRPEERIPIYKQLAGMGVHGLEIAPGLLFPDCPDPLRPGPDIVRERLAEIAAFDLRIVSIQSIHFGADQAQLFGTASQRQLFTDRLIDAVELAASLHAPNIVLGSPKQRVRPPHLKAAEASLVAVQVLRQVGERASRVGTTLSVEVNPVEYGANFVTTFDEGIRLLEEIDHASVKMCLDMGTIALTEGNDLSELVRSVSPHLGHVHISDPYLARTPSDPALLRSLAAQLRDVEYAGWLSIEMRSTGPNDRDAVRSSVAGVQRGYCG